jgi:hypothetical protein
MTYILELLIVSKAMAYSTPKTRQSVDMVVEFNVCVTLNPIVPTLFDILLK